MATQRTTSQAANAGAGLGPTAGVVTNSLPVTNSLTQVIFAFCDQEEAAGRKPTNRSVARALNISFRDSLDPLRLWRERKASSGGASDPIEAARKRIEECALWIANEAVSRERKRGEAEIEALKAHNVQLIGDLADADDEAAHQDERLEKATQERDRAALEASESAARAHKLGAELAAARDALSEEATARAAAESQKQELEREVSIQREQIAAHASDLAHWQRSCAQLQAQVTRLLARADVVISLRDENASGG